NAVLTRHRPEDPVAFGEGGPRTAHDLLVDASKFAAALPVARERSHVMLVFESDRYAFAAALLGAWSRGHAVALPPNSRGQTVHDLLARPEICCVVHDTRAGGPHLRADAILSGRPSALLERSSIS